MRAHRLDRELSRTVVARAAHVSESYLAKIEQGIAPRPSGTALDNLAKVLKLSFVDIRTLYFLAGRAMQSDVSPLPAEARLANIEGIGGMRVALFDAAFTLISANSSYKETFFGVEDHQTTPEWLFFDPRARIVHEDWEGEARRAVWWLRQIAPKRAPVPVLGALLDRLIAQPDFERLWIDPTLAIAMPEPLIRLRDYATRRVVSFDQAFYKRIDSTMSIYVYVVTPTTSLDSH
ncbi:hypothetical protein B2J88_47315 [Rhodococcus sp. SRB_17]|nr:hypothetical protein [Rhodococcus sp. SRB_17]